MKQDPATRWIIAAAGTGLQMCLGTVYAWSDFQKPIAEANGWSASTTVWTFSIAILCLGAAAAWGGLQLPRFGPRRLAVAGGLLFGGGYLVAAGGLHLHSWPLLYLGYGVIGGIGLGLGYVTPVATVAKWFPDKKGLATGMVIMGFGLGAMLMSKLLAPYMLRMCHNDYALFFACLGVFFMIAASACAMVLRNPPEEDAPSDAPPASSAAGAAATPGATSAWEAISSPTFALMWFVFFCNIVVGISMISFQSPLLQDLLKRVTPSLNADTTEVKDLLAGYGATLIAVSSLFNGIGRMFWGALSDRIGRATTFRVMLGSQIFAFILLMIAPNPWVFCGLVCYVLLCYGGGFGAMPAFVLDVFGKRLMAVVYGMMLTAWSIGGVVGPQLVARLKDNFPGSEASRYAFMADVLVVSVGLALSLLLSDRAFAAANSATTTPPAEPAPLGAAEADESNA